MAELIDAAVEEISSLENVRICPCCGDVNQVAVAAASTSDYTAHRDIRQLGVRMQFFCGNCGAEYEVTANYEAQDSGFRLLRASE